MKKLLLLTKTLLAVALLCVGQNAWAKSSVWSEDFENTTIEALKSAWTSNDATWGATYSPTLELQTNKCNNTTTWFNTFSPTLKRQSTAYYMFATAYTANAYQFDAKLNLNVGSNGEESRFYIMNGTKSGTNAAPSNFLFYIGVNSSGKVYISNGTNSEVSTIGGYESGANSIAATLQNKNYKSTGWFDASCIIDLAQGKATVTVSAGSTEETFTINLKSGTKQISGFGVLGGAKYYGVVAMDDMVLYELSYPTLTLSEDEKAISVDASETVSVTGINGAITAISSDEAIATVSYSEGTVTINGVASGVAYITVKATNDGVTVSKVITATVGTVPTTTITVNYLCGGTPIASPTTIEDVTIGSELTIGDITYNTTVAGDGCRYVNPSFSVDFPYTVVENGVINVNYTQQNAVSTLKIYGSVAGNNYLLHTYNLDGKYVGDAVAVTYPEYYVLNGTIYSTANKQFSGSDFYSGSFTLTGTDPVLTYNKVESNVVYFSEAENIVGGTENAGSNANIRCSDAKGAFFESATDVVTLPAGRYTIHSQVWGGHNTDDSKNVDFTFNDGTSDFYVHRTTGALSPKSQEFTLTSPATITVTGGSSGKVLDLVYIVKTGEVATIGATGWTTFASSYPLDLSSMTASTGAVTAYYASNVDGSEVTMTSTESDAVAAGTGIMLKGTASATITIPVAASAGTAISGNKLIGCTTETGLGANDNYYVLVNNGGTAEFQCLDKSGATIPAGKAYLNISGPSARSMSIVLGDNNITGVANVEAAAEAKAKEGKFIENGKLVIVKNGQKFNAAGAQVK